MKTKQIVLAKRPTGTPGRDTFRTEEVELPAVGDGQVHVRSLYYSVDPYMRGRMSDKKSYAPPFKLDEPIIGGIVGEVIESNTPELKPGFIVTGRLPWKEQFVIDAASLKEIEKDDAVPLSAHLGVLGMPGLTAYVGMVLIGRPAKGETVVISGAAGAVGSAAGQIAKIFGCRVIGIAGSDEKCKVLTDEFGFDAAINYKTEKQLSKAIEALCPKGVDIYFDNVGGEISDAVIENLNFHARIPLCGQISMYNSDKPESGPRQFPILLTKSVLVQGFIVSNFNAYLPEGAKQLTQWLKEGKLKYKETIIEGFEKLPDAFLALFTGDNTGKMIVKS